MLLFMDGFDLYAPSGNIASLVGNHWIQAFSDGPGLAVAAGRYVNSKGVLFGSGGKGWSGLTSPVGGFGAATKLIVGFNFKYANGVSSEVNFRFFSKDMGQIGSDYNNIRFLSWGADRRVILRLNTAEVGSFAITPEQWYHCELVLFKTSDTHFSAQLFIDDNQVVSSGATPVQTSPKNFWFQGMNANLLTIDDFYILNDVASGNMPVDKLGSNARIETLFPTQPKNGVDVWVPTGAANTADAVNDVPYSLTKFAATPNADSVQEFSFQPLTNIIAAKGSQLRTVAKGITGAQLKHVVNGTVVDTKALTGGYTNYSTIVDLTASQINSLTAGVSS